MMKEEWGDNSENTISTERAQNIYALNIKGQIKHRGKPKAWD